MWIAEIMWDRDMCKTQPPEAKQIASGGFLCGDGRERGLFEAKRCEVEWILWEAGQIRFAVGRKR